MPYMSHICPIVLVKNLNFWCLTPSTSSDFFAGTKALKTLAQRIQTVLQVTWILHWNQKNCGKSKNIYKMMENMWMFHDVPDFSPNLWIHVEEMGSCLEMRCFGLKEQQPPSHLIRVEDVSINIGDGSRAP